LRRHRVARINSISQAILTVFFRKILYRIKTRLISHVAGTAMRAAIVDEIRTS
jgi:hypothetical protein